MDGTGRPAGDDETWTVGEAARYLNAGGVNFRVRPKTVRLWADDPDHPIMLVSGGEGRWRRVLASTVRAYRRRILAELGRSDPG